MSTSEPEFPQYVLAAAEIKEDSPTTLLLQLGVYDKSKISLRPMLPLEIQLSGVEPELFQLTLADDQARELGQALIEAADKLEGD